MIFSWKVTRLVDLASKIAELAGSRQPAVIGIDGHSSSGKTTLASRLASVLPGSGVLHTDDLAWHEGVFTWDRLLIDDVLPVVRTGAALDYRPPAWQARSRPGAVRLAAHRRWVLIEGVGASQPSLRDELDVAVWVETDEPTRLTRDAARVAAGEISAGSYKRWIAEENTYVATHRPWEHADLVIKSGQTGGFAPTTEVVIAERAGRRRPGGRGTA